MNAIAAETTENTIHYTLHGDYYLPDLELPETSPEPIGKYGLMRLAYLRDHRPGLYTRLILSGRLYDHLAEIDRTAHNRLDIMIPKMAAAEGITEALKAENPMIWVARMNSIRSRAEETVLDEMIYS